LAVVIAALRRMRATGAAYDQRESGHPVGELGTFVP